VNAKNMMDENIILIQNTVSHIFANIFISGLSASMNPDILKRYNIKFILFLNEETKPEELMEMYEHMGIIHKEISIGDLPTSNISQHFGEVIRFINKYISSKKGNILIHCTMGVSRACTALLVYMLYRHYNRAIADRKYPKGEILPGAISFIKARRPFCQPNPGFLKQLEEYEDYLTSRAHEIITMYKGKDNNLIYIPLISSIIGLFIIICNR
jgi:dual specificity phosphatase 12